MQPIDAAVPDAAVPDAAVPDAATMSTTITSEGVGPITARATTEHQFRKLLPGFEVISERHEAEDYVYDEITVRKGKAQVIKIGDHVMPKDSKSGEYALFMLPEHYKPCSDKPAEKK